MSAPGNRSAAGIRSAFLRYFEQREHRVVSSSSLVPGDDPTLLFANAGMNQFKDVLLGLEQRDYKRAASSQKCVRAGGKHNDLENVGHTARHHTFFEMLGNFSFGDYFKREAIAYAWELLTKELGLDPQRLAVTVYSGEGGFPRDEEAERLWEDHLPRSKISALGMKDNFWAMGDTGPCGPCSEIHFFQTDDLPCAEEAAGRICLGVACECDRWLEIWNLVFMQLERGEDGKVRDLPTPSIDTGMGLERVAAVVQGKLSNYDTDLFTPLLAAAASKCDKVYGGDPRDDVSLRVIADHLRALTFLIADGVMPGNEGRGYVLRKIMRRAMRHGRRLGIEGAFLGELSQTVVDHMAGAFPDLVNQSESVKRVVEVEEDRFGTTLKQAFAVFEAVAEPLKAGDTIRGEDAFRLYDTYGLALDFTEELASDRDLRVDHEGFDRELKAQQERARKASKMGTLTGDPVSLELLEQGGGTEFRGYAAFELEGARVLAVLKEGKLASRLDAGEEGSIVLDQTPFYAASGGQVGDHGVLSADGSTAEVFDCATPVRGLHVHQVRVSIGGFEPGMVVSAKVDAARRAGAMRNHTGTHLLHAALREILGPHVKQAGSLVAPDRLRFDFSHYAHVTPRELRHIESRVNGEILKGTGLETKVMGLEEALEYGALAFFGDKYGARVRVVEVPGFSKEFCGGTHVQQTGEIGLFLFTHEQGISAGTRRVEALTGEAALERAREDQGILEELEQTAKTDRRRLVDEYARLQEQLKSLQREHDRLKLQQATQGGNAAGDDLTQIEGVKVWTPRFDGLERKAHASVVDDFRNRNKDSDFLVLSSAVGQKGVHVIAAVSGSLHDRINAKDLMRRLELRGGGREDFAQGGGVEADGVEALQRRATHLAREILEGVRA